MTDHQKQCVREYTDSTYQIINSQLRQAQGELSDINSSIQSSHGTSVRELVRGIDGAFKTDASKLESSMTLYRGTYVNAEMENGEQIHAAVVDAAREEYNQQGEGTWLKDYGYSSWSKNTSTSLGFSGTGYTDDNQRVLFVYEAKKGEKLLDLNRFNLSKIPSEKEVMMPRGAWLHFGEFLGFCNTDDHHLKYLSKTKEPAYGGYGPKNVAVIRITKVSRKG